MTTTRFFPAELVLKLTSKGQTVQPENPLANSWGLPTRLMRTPRIFLAELIQLRCTEGLSMLIVADINLKGTDCTARESIGKLMRSANETDENTKNFPGWINSVEMHRRTVNAHSCRHQPQRDRLYSQRIHWQIHEVCQRDWWEHQEFSWLN